MIKVDIISGFLGAGKTTLIKHLLGHVYGNENVVLIENEFGEIGIDGCFLKEAGIEIKEMNSGCICCSLVGDFATSLKEVVDTYHPDRIIIEPSGVGKLSDVEKAVMDIASEVGLEVDHKVVVADVSKCKMYLKNFGEFYKNQIENANTIILSRTDIAKEGKVEETLELLKALNDKAAVVTTPVDTLEDAVLIAALNNKESAVSMLDELEEKHEHSCNHHDHEEEYEHEHEHHCCHHDHEEHEHHHHAHQEHHVDEHGHCSCGHDHGHDHHHADDVFTSWGVETSVAFTKSKLEEIFNKFENETKGTILRSKGIVKNAESDTWIYFDYVPGQVDIRDGNPDYTGKVCVIAAGYSEEELRNIFMN